MPVNSRVAIVVDALPFLSGAEKVLMAALELFPRAPIFTMIYNAPAFRRTPIAGRTIFTSFINRLPFAATHYKRYFPLMPAAVRRFDLGAYDAVLSFSYAVAHGVSTHSGQRHLSYTFTPMRYAWRRIGLNGTQAPQNVTSLLLGPFRKWDAAAASRIDQLASVSGWIAQWVRRAYGRESTVIYPPVDVERFTPGAARGDFYISVSRLVAHKRVDLIIQAFNWLRLPLIVVGDGPERARLARLAGPDVRLCGYLPDRELASLLAQARAFVCAGEEDFGIAAVEAQAAGCPVIAYRKGGALETVREGETGLFFDQPSADSLIEAVIEFEATASRFDARQIAASVQRFNKARFLAEFQAFVQHGAPKLPADQARIV